jgi:hypothetical protein
VAAVDRDESDRLGSVPDRIRADLLAHVEEMIEERRHRANRENKLGNSA